MKKSLLRLDDQLPRCETRRFAPLRCGGVDDYRAFVLRKATARLHANEASSGL